MKKYIYILGSIVFLTLLSCNEESFYQKEQYKPVIYLLSKDNYNIYPNSYEIKDGQQVSAFFSVGCGGSLANPEEVIVKLESDTVLLDRYNKLNFDVDTAKFAKILHPSKYVLETDEVVIPANNEEQYTKVGVTVDLVGLSPDSTYFICLAIKGVSKYEVNPKKSNMLYRVAQHNKYAEQLVETYYKMSGSSMNEKNEIRRIATTKFAKPLSEKSIRIFAGDYIQDLKTSIETIREKSIIVTIDDNNKVKVSSYGTVEVEHLESVDPMWNTYEEIKTPGVNKIDKYFYLFYKYRLLKSPATEIKPAEWGEWFIVQETLTRFD